VILAGVKMAVAIGLAAVAAAPACADVLEIGARGEARWIAGPRTQSTPVTVTNARVPDAYAAKVAELAARYDLSPALIEAVVWQESRWHAGAVSPAGARGLAQLISGKRTQRVNIENVAITNIAENRILGIPILVWMLLVVGAIGWVVLNRTTFGRRTFATGGNPEAARLAGINLRLHTMLLYGLSGLCCGIAAIMVVAQATAGAPDHGDLYELDAIAACIIGGTALAGGRGSIVGAILGVFVFKGITNLFIVNNLEQEYQLIVKGAIIVGAVLLQQFRVGSLRQFRKQPT